MQRIPLGNGLYSLVDDADYEWLSAFSWYHHKGYARRHAGKRRAVYMHQLLLIAPPGFTVDHKNGDGLDNRRENLRPATTQQNQQNGRKRVSMKSRPTSSRYKGVHWNKRDGKWHVRIRAAGRRLWLGYFDHEEDAASAYREAALRLHGEFARP